MLKYEDSVIPYLVHSTLNLRRWRRKDANLSWMSYLCLFTETVAPERKVLFSKLHDKINEIRDKLPASPFVT